MEMQTLPTQADALRQRLHDVTVKAARLDGVRKADFERNEELKKEVASAKGRAGLAEEVARIFEALQTRAHQRNVGSFERLLTAILKDVLPAEGAVRLIPEYKNNTTWLDIALEKEGQLEDLLDGNGGAVTNVICAGLRFAALSRTSNRRLMILDEPDCWLKPERVPAFVRVLSQVATNTKTQTFIISHHDASYFEGRTNIVRLLDDELIGAPYAEAVEPVVSRWADDTTPGIRSIELINFRRHVHTVIPCFPGATAITGDNNGGKSTAMVASLRAVGYGESDDRMIRHGEDEARIIIHLEENKRIEWSRSKKRSPSVIYKLFDGDTLLKEGRPKTRNSAPEWVVEVLGVTPVDDLDIQVGNQKSPVFLLNDTASRRAQILSVGRESSHLKVLMARYEAVKSADRETIKQGEAQVAKLTYRLGLMQPLEPVAEKLEALKAESGPILRMMEGYESLAGLIGKLEQLHETVARHEKAVAALATLPAVPVIEPLDKLEDLIVGVERHGARTRFDVPEALPAIPQLCDVQEITAIGQKIAGHFKRMTVLSQLPEAMPVAPALEDTADLAKLLERLGEQGRRVGSAEQTLASDEKALQIAGEQLEALKQELGGACPLCGGALPEKGVKHAHAH